MNKRAPILDVRNLSIAFQDDDGREVQVVDSVSFHIHEGEVFGLVGESGCGKTVTSLAVLRLLPKPASRILGGSITFDGKPLLALPGEEVRKIRGAEISMIFQEPGSALNPLMTIERQLRECFEYHPNTGINPANEIAAILKRVGFSDPERILSAYPHELSGGMAQRVVISMALLLKPKLIIADEPTTALDVTVQAQIMELLAELQKEFGTAILLITHNLNLIAQYTGRLAVMYAGRIAEECTVERFLQGPAHPYTRGLMNAIPTLAGAHQVLTPIPGQVPQPSDFEDGCRFRERCGQALDICTGKPGFSELAPDHRVSCFLYPQGGAA